MKKFQSILQQRSFLGGAAGIFLVQLLILQFSTPLYDIDTNSFIRGGLSWDIYHNPFENIFLALIRKISSNPDFILSFQILAFSLSVSLLAHLLFSRKLFLFIALSLASIEPVSLFYNFSFLPESFYTSFTLLYCSFLILCLRESDEKVTAFFTGVCLGMAFLCKLSAMTQICLLILLLLKKERNLLEKTRNMALALTPFLCCYFFVLAGQHFINNAGLYVVSGRVRWDFSNSQYNPDEIEADDFKRFVHPHFLKNGKIPENRELRRELSFIGYKDCMEENLLLGKKEVYAIQACDSIFGNAGSQILKKHPGAAQLQFIKDNISAIHHLNYLDYRFTPGLPFYHSEKEYTFLDSLMKINFGFNLAERKDKLLMVWRNLEFTNIYIPVLWWLTWIGLFISGGLILKKTGLFSLNRKTPARSLLFDPVILTLSATLIIPWVFHLVYISYRPRFLAPYFLIGIYLGLYLVSELIVPKIISMRKNHFLK